MVALRKGMVYDQETGEMESVSYTYADKKRKTNRKKLGFFVMYWTCWAAGMYACFCALQAFGAGDKHEPIQIPQKENTAVTDSENVKADFAAKTDTVFWNIGQKIQSKQK